MKYLKPFKSTNENKRSKFYNPMLDPKRIPSLIYDIEVIFADMTDDVFQIDIRIGSYFSYVELTINDIDWMYSRYFHTTLEKYSNSLYHFFDYMTDEGFNIEDIDLSFKSGKDSKYEINLNNPTDEVLNKTLVENKYKILNKLEICFTP